MAIDYCMPKLAMAMNEGTINEWLVTEGSFVEVGQTLATIETEKVAYDVESPDAGYLHIIVGAGETIACDGLLAQFAESEEELVQLRASSSVGDDKNDSEAGSVVSSASAAPAPKQSATSSSERIKASPLARKMAADAKLDISRITGTGPGGRIVKRDVMAAESRGLGATLHTEAELARIPMQGMRSTIASRMTQSLQESAQLSANWESDITGLLAMRKQFVAREEQLGTRVSFNAFLIRALVYAVRQVPIANSCLEGDEIVIYNNVNVGVAVSVPGSTQYDSGLMVAVLHNVERMGVVEIDKAMKALVERVREGRAGKEDLTGSTITLSSTAGIAPPGMTTTPVLNSPNTALIGPSTPIERPAMHNEEIVKRTFLPLSFTFDHRVMDGEPAARYMRALHDCLEHPELMLA